MDRYEVPQGFPGGSVVKNPLPVQVPQETWVRSLGGEDPLEEEMASHSSILAWKILWTEEPGRLQSMGSQRVGQDWVINTHICIYSPAELSWKSPFWGSPRNSSWSWLSVEGSRWAPSSHCCRWTALTPSLARSSLSAPLSSCPPISPSSVLLWLWQGWLVTCGPQHLSRHLSGSHLLARVNWGDGWARL